MRMQWSEDNGNKGPKKDQNVDDLLFARLKLHWWLLGLIVLLAAFFIAYPQEEQRKFLDLDKFQVGGKIRRDVFAPIDATYFDEVATEAERQKASMKVPPVFDLEFQRLEDAKKEFNIVRQVRASYMLDDDQKVAEMRQRFIIGPTDAVGHIMVTASDEQIDEMEKEVIRILSNILVEGVVPGGDDSSFTKELSEVSYIKPEWERIRKKLEKETSQKATNGQIAAMMQVNIVGQEPAVDKIVPVEDLREWIEATNAARAVADEMSEPIRTVVKEISVDLMRPNLKYNPILTRERQAKRIENFPPVRQRIAKGGKIIGIGEVVTESTVTKLKARSRAQKLAILRAIPGALILAVLLAYALIIYLKKYEPSVFSEPRKIIALNAAILLVLVLGYIIIVWGPKSIERPGFLIPVALASIVVAILASVQLAIVVTCIVGVFIALLAGVNLAGSLEYFLVILAGGTAAAMSASRARHRRHLIIAGVYVSGANVAIILGLGLLENVSPANLGTNCLMGAVNGVIVALLAPGLLPIFEYLSRTTTDMELLELADLNQPLLVQLKAKASGSYYHSLRVAELGWAAAEEMGVNLANPLLVRVGSYYHDIGKINKPEYFIENQKGENIHDGLNPNMSARVIKAHVKDGVSLARDHKLPQAIIDIIQQHHGSTLIGGQRFYQKALETDRHNTVRLEDYRYSGPKPQTKEAAIVHLADSVESASVVLHDNPTYRQLLNFVRGIVEGKIVDFQLDECDLTFKDISLIIESFARVLSGMYHTRIEYPKEAEAVQGATGGGGTGEPEQC